MSQFHVLHNYGMEGWRFVEFDGSTVFASILDAVNAREADLQSGGGESIIVEAIPVLEAYRRADYEAGKSR